MSQQQFFCNQNSIIVQFKFANEPAPVIYIFRRVLIWGVKPFWSEGVSGMETRSLAWLSGLETSSIGDDMWIDGEFGTKVNELEESRKVDEYLCAELWLWSNNGWCLSRQLKSWTEAKKGDTTNTSLNPKQHVLT